MTDTTYCQCNICMPERDERGIYCGYCGHVIIPFSPKCYEEDVLLDVADELTRLRVENEQLKAKARRNE